MAVGVAPPSGSSTVLSVLDKARGDTIDELPIDDPDAVAAACSRARGAQKGWGALPVRARARLLRRARREIVRDRSAILDLLDRETGKARFDTVGELMGTCLELGYLTRRAARFLKPRRVSARPLYGKKGHVVYVPRGVVGIISPWNAPLNLALGDAIPGLLAGNAVVIKPSELTPLAVKRAAAAMNRVLPPGVLQVLIGAGPTGAALVDHVDMICVTGSPETGRRVMERASRHLTPVLLELGGKDPMIVLRDADLERATNGAVYGSCLMSGQVCMSVERVYVEVPIVEEFTRRVVEKMQALRVGANGPASEIDYGPFTSARQVDIVERQIADAVARGAKVLTGGRRRQDGAGIYFEPTVLANVDHSMLIMTEETFGPVLPIMPVASAEEAIRLANDTTYGLNASVWTTDVARGLEIARQIDAGSTCVNECLVSAGCSDLPFGGLKQSGLGQRHGGAEGLRQFCVAKAILAERPRKRTEISWFPYSTKRARQTEWLMGLLFRW